YSIRYSRRRIEPCTRRRPEAATGWSAPSRSTPQRRSSRSTRAPRPWLRRFPCPPSARQSLLGSSGAPTAPTARRSMKVIGAGLPRTATTTQMVALEQLGFAPCYHMRNVLGDLENELPHWEAAQDGN